MTFNFAVKKREGQAEELRAQGQIPGVLYGASGETISLSADYNTFWKLYNEAGESSLIDLSIDGGKVEKVIIQDVQFDPVKQRVSHFDLHRIDMNKEMHATIELNFIGEAPAVKELAGTLMKAQDTLDIKCLPKDLVAEVNVDLTTLKTFEDVIHVKDLVLPAGIIAVEDGNQVLAKVAAPITEEQIKAMEEEGSKGLEAVEVEKKEKVEEDEESTDEKKDEGKKE